MEKIVKFDDWCDSCKYCEADPDKDDNPCNECLTEPVNIDSHKPVRWKEK